MPSLWASGDDLGDFVATLTDDSSTKNVEVITEHEDEYLLRMEWMVPIRVIL